MRLPGVVASIRAELDRLALQADAAGLTLLAARIGDAVDAARPQPAAGVVAAAPPTGLTPPVGGRSGSPEEPGTPNGGE